MNKVSDETMRPASQEEDIGPEIPSMYTPAQLRLLKIAVIGMGVILLAGFTIVIGRIIYIVNSAPETKPAMAQPASPSLVAPAALALPKGAVVRHLAISGSRLAIHFEGPSGSGVQVVDLVPGGSTVTIPIVERPQ
jgi:hypothetical protein